MKILVPNIVILLVFILMISTCTWAQDKELPEPQMDSGPGGPPPPGLIVPLDTNKIFLLVAGICLGTYFLTASGKKSTSIQ